jgi:FKBP-type peptidyl-prolyl cis-trans isomerase SlyD
MLIAVPCEAPGGLDAEISAHFGHCHAFTLVRIDDGSMGEVSILENGGHGQGGCMAPVMLLKEREVNALVAGGMGMRPLSGFQGVGITVYHQHDARTVRDAVQLIIDGRAQEFDVAQTCGGGGECGGHDHHHHHPVKREPIVGKADIREGRVVTFHYKLTNSKGELLDSSEQDEPMSYLHGHGSIVPGLEKALTGLEAGAHQIVKVSAAEGYGERDESKIFELPRDRLPDDVQVGAMLHAEQPNGQMIILTVVELNDKEARLDPNHPLAGLELTFDVTIVKVEAATAEELAHGHSH